MRIGLVLDEFNAQRGGLERWNCQFATHLARRGHEVHVVARCFAPSAFGLPIVPHRLQAAASRCAFAEAAEAKLRSLELDLVHDMGVGWYCDVFQPHGGSWSSAHEQSLLACPRWMRPLRRSFDPWLPRHRDFRSLLARQYASTRKIIVALSHLVADDLRRLHHVPAEQIRVVYNGVDVNCFSPDHRAQHRQAVRRSLGIAEDTLLLLIVAHNFRLKGVPTLLNAMRQLARRRLPVHLLVVGGKQKHLWHWRRTARQLGVGAGVTFAGPADDTVPYYAAADVYVHPTLYDPCSLVLLEAAASGLPIITTEQANGVAELMTDGEEALLVSDPTDAGQLALRIESMLDGFLRQRMGRAARRMALRHTFDRNVEEMLDVYQAFAPARRAAA